MIKHAVHVITSDSSHPFMAESLQQLILDHLDIHGSLSDSRNITIPGSTAPATDADSQISILGALNSLLSREVSDQPSP
jgi:phenylalanyl-tRNA synthetase alpha chain